MAIYSGPAATATAPASGDLSASQYCFVTLNTSGQVAVAGAGATPVGVLKNAPNAAGDPATYWLCGSGAIVKLKVDGNAAAITEDGQDKLKSDASGRGVLTVTDKDYYAAIGHADSSAQGDIIAVRLESGHISL